MMSYHVSPTWHEWNVSSDNIMAHVLKVKFAHLSIEWPGVHISQPELSENNCFIFSGTKYPKCKWEHAKHDSHHITQKDLH